MLAGSATRGPRNLVESAARNGKRPAEDSAFDGFVHAGCYVAAIVVDIETRLLACLWIDPGATYNFMLRAGVCAGNAFAWHVHRDLASTLLARAAHFARTGQKWSLAAVARTVRDLGTDPELSEIRGIVGSESSAAGAASYSRLLAIALRRRRQIRRLYRALRNLMDDPLAETPAVAPQPRRKGRAA